MTDRQRAFVSALVYVMKNKKFHSNHSVGVKRLPDGALMYEFRGKWLKDSISLRDDKYISITDSDFYNKPWGVMIRWQGIKLGTANIKILIPDDGSQFSGHDGEFERFEGTYYSPSDSIEIRDYSQDKYKYTYRITW